MKKISILLIALCSILSTQAAQVKSAKIVGDKLLVDVTHGGGCGEHHYDLKLGLCYETNPVQCEAELIHETNDPCEAFVYKTVEFSLENKGLTDSYFRNGSLTIYGDKDWQTGEKSNATVILK
jgi:hypothetical protein